MPGREASAGRRVGWRDSCHWRRGIQERHCRVFCTLPWETLCVHVVVQPALHWLIAHCFISHFIFLKRLPTLWHYSMLLHSSVLTRSRRQVAAISNCIHGDGYCPISAGRAGVRKSRLEGNPITWPEVKTLMDGVTVGGHRIDDQRQVLNLADAPQPRIYPLLWFPVSIIYRYTRASP